MMEPNGFKKVEVNNSVLMDEVGHPSAKLGEAHGNIIIG